MSTNERPGDTFGLSPEQMAVVDEWRAGEPDHPSRSEAVRRLIERGLMGAPKRGDEGLRPQITSENDG
jgi:hypothetical protein